MIIQLLGNIIPVFFGIIAIWKWKSSKLDKTEIGKRLGVAPFSTFQLLFGIIIGAFIFTIIFIIYIYYNLLTVIQFSWPGANIFLNILMFAALAMGEEFIFRSFFINGLRIYIKSTSFILIISAIFFSLVHWFNDGSTVLSALSAFIGGFMYAYAFVKTDKLWLPIGLHFSWNFFQSFVYGFPVSGYVFEGIFKVNISGQELWTGGAYGPEGSLIGILGRFYVIFTIWSIIKMKYGK